MKLEKAQQQLDGRLLPGERVLVSVTGGPLANAESINARSASGDPVQLVGQSIGGAIVRGNDAMIQRNAVTGAEGTIARAVPTQAEAFGLVLTDRRLALHRRGRMLELEDVAWEVPRERIVGMRKLARTTVMRRMRVVFDDGSAVELAVSPGKAMRVLRDELGKAAN